MAISMKLHLRNIPLGGMRMLKIGPNVIQTASIIGRTTRGEPIRFPKPFPYETKKLNWLTGKLDPTMVKLSQENARLISVDGPIAVGKSAFCKALAEEFDMLYMPEPTMDEYYILPSGYDLRQHDHELPEKVKSYDHRNFCVDPTNVKAGNFQIKMLYLRFQQLLNALCHMMNTGQGVIMERSYYSDFAFIKAMHENKYISKGVLDAYFEIYKNTSIIFPNPHLVIYLDIPVPVVQERIRTRNYSYEQGSPALTTEYLKSLEVYWKQEYLKKTQKCSEILVYDWTDGGDIEVVVDDIEKLDFDIMRKDFKFIDWRISRTRQLDIRMTVTNNPQSYDRYFYFPTYEVDELFIPVEDNMKLGDVLSKIPECKYDKGYNYLMGDSIFSILFNISTVDHRRQRRHLHYSTTI